MSLALYLGAQLARAAEDLHWVPAGLLRPLSRLGAVSILRPGDKKYHCSDGSHRWIAAGPEHDQEVWDEQVRQHKEGHLRNDRPP
ncbi:hypothetical protein [Micromonospora chersina]|uniref:hypothetical protein n=1 Tax=Micromonospora chersina TaxID=47854 RepID=UPI003713A741